VALDLLSGRAGRLSFRTVSVLRVIAAESGLSNKEVALRAGARDEGQISRVLSRLSRQGILETTRDDRIPGATNAWRLTTLGAQLETAVRHETPTPERRVTVELPRLDIDRLDHRTPALLRALGEQPRVATTEVGLRAGFADAFGASKLLARLARAGLVQRASSPGRGGNAWQLTAAGAALHEQLARSTPTRLRSTALDLMRESGGRLSDRAISVLRAVGVEPGISNRGVAARVGCSAQMDVSEPLACLRQRALIENSRNGGRENAWRLTPSGKRLHHAIARETPAPPPGLALDLMRASGVRLNHRSAAMLVLVAREPGLSNAEIALRTGLESPGHASTLLAGLARRGLIETARTTGYRNAWHLTPAGERLTAAIRDAPQPTVTRSSRNAVTANA
jgi:DNA-binding MarR family transcriptional regulator